MIFVVFHMGSYIAACPAVGTDRVNFFNFLVPSLARPLLAGQSTGGTDGNALAAEFAVEVFFIVSCRSWT